MREQPGGRDSLWLSMLAVMVVFFLLGWWASGSGGSASSPSFSTGGGPMQEQLAVAAMTALVPTATVVLTPKPTATVWMKIVTVTPTATMGLPWCWEAKLNEECQQIVPAMAVTNVPLQPSCEMMTPVASTSDYTYACRKTDRLGTNGENDAGGDAGALGVTVTPTELPADPMHY